MIWAASFSAPVVFFCQNNQYAISVPLERQSRVPLYRRAAGFGGARSLLPHRYGRQVPLVLSRSTRRRIGSDRQAGAPPTTARGRTGPARGRAARRGAPSCAFTTGPSATGRA